MLATIPESAPKGPVGHHPRGRYLPPFVSVNAVELFPMQGANIEFNGHIRRVSDSPVVAVRGNPTISWRGMARNISPTSKVRVSPASERIRF